MIKSDFGLIGLAVMGQNLILNMNDHGFTVVAYNRTAAKVEEFLGKEAKGYMDSGALVPDSLIMGIMEQRLQEPDAAKGFLLDGFPRTVNQAEALDKIVRDREMELVVLNFDVPRAVLLRRALRPQHPPAHRLAAPWRRAGADGGAVPLLQHHGLPDGRPCPAQRQRLQRRCRQRR